MSMASVSLFIDTLIIQNSPPATAKQLAYLDDLFKKRYKAERPQHVHLTKAEASRQISILNNKPVWDKITVEGFDQTLRLW